MIVDISTCSFQGGRDYNEDSVHHAEKDGVFVIVVADGLGGHGGGQIASRVVADEVTRLFFENPLMEPENIQRIFNEVNTSVLSQQTPHLKMKSTGVCLFVKDDVVMWGHAGDSRVYHFYDDHLVSQTLDHSVSQMAVLSGEITQDEIRTHEDRNKVIKAFGGSDQLIADISSPLSLLPGNHAFLLCTDGFWEYVLEQEMELDLAKCKEPDLWLDTMCARINRTAPVNNDNFSAAAVFCRN